MPVQDNLQKGKVLATRLRPRVSAPFPPPLPFFNFFFFHRKKFASVADRGFAHRCRIPIPEEIKFFKRSTIYEKEMASEAVTNISLFLNRNAVGGSGRGLAVGVLGEGPS